MSRSGVSLNWGGLGKTLFNAVRNLADRQVLLEGVGEMLVTSTKQRFEDEAGPDGTAWKQSQRAQAEGGKTLTKSAVLKRSIDYKATSDAVMVGAGSNLKYARIHQLGGKAGRGVTLPARPYLGLSDEDRADVQELVADFIADALTGGGR